MSRPRLVVTIAKGVELAFRLIPAGTFRMGQRGIRADEEPVHTVVIPYSFWMAETPVTQAQYATFNPNHVNGFPNQPTCPAERVTWQDAQKYVQAINQHCRAMVPEGYRVALPFEAEWEYACRAGTTTEFHSGDGEAALDKVGWFDKNSGMRTQDVAQKVPNDWGLFDMHGNVWEWCEDVWDADVYKERAEGFIVERNRSTDSGASRRVLRGGSWFDSAPVCRAAWRFRNRSDYWFRVGGSRLVLVPGPQAQPVGDQASGAGGQSRSARDERGGVAHGRRGPRRGG